MLPEGLWIFQKHSIYKGKVGASKYKSSLKKLTSMIYENFILETLLLALHCYCGDKKKHRFLSNHLFQRKQEYGGWKEPQGNDKLF